MTVVINRVTHSILLRQFGRFCLAGQLFLYFLPERSSIFIKLPSGFCCVRDD